MNHIDAQQPETPNVGRPEVPNADSSPKWIQHILDFGDTEDIEKQPGGDTDYYRVPEDAKMLQDLIEFKDMNWNIANVFKAMYRYGGCSHSDKLRDVNKALWFLEREKARLS